MLDKAPRLRARGHRLLAILGLLCASLNTHYTLPASGAATPATRTTQACEGDACASITLTWEEEGQRFRADNSSDRRVRVEVETFGGTSAVTVEPASHDYLQVKTFNGPYHARFE
jgi:hypothetical protein